MYVLVSTMEEIQDGVRRAHESDDTFLITSVTSYVLKISLAQYHIIKMHAI